MRNGLRGRRFGLAIAVMAWGCGGDGVIEPGDEVGPAEPVQVTAIGGSGPSASPDGSWIAFTVAGGGIAKIRVDGSDFEMLTETGRSPDWSRAGSLILFDGGPLCTVHATTKETACLPVSGYEDPVWSPARDEITGDNNDQEVVLIGYPEGVETIVPCDDPDGSLCDNEGPTWSPDGEWIAFEDGLEILKVRRTGGTAQVVVSGLGDVTTPAWSPNGRWIAFSLEDSPGGPVHIWVADARGIDFGLWQVTDGPGDDHEPAWSPGSGILYFRSTRSGQSEIWKVGFNLE